MDKDSDKNDALKAYRDQMRQLIEAMALNIFEGNNDACSHPDNIEAKLQELDIAIIERKNERIKVKFLDKCIPKQKTDT